MDDQRHDDMELVSALADGELDGDDFRRALAFLESSDEAMNAWHAYHVAGDVLRCADMAVSAGGLAFAARVRAGLEGTQVAGASAPRVWQPAPTAQVMAAPAASNDPTTRWKALAGVACLVALASLAWHVDPDADSGRAAQLALGAPSVAASSAAVAAAAEPGVMVRDARLDELMAAHKQLGGSTALQAPSGFLRNATFEGQARR